ncbi:MAG: hypothetical protein J5980_04555 [Muribaculaceae bacterium]|nr:hypothetical protein [Muribaculaceae bacterium]
MTNVMDEELNQQHIQQIQELEQLRVNLEMMEDTKPSRKGWIVVVIFFIISLCAFFAFKAGAQSLTFADRNIERRALLKGDTDGDGHISRVEADSVKSLILTQYRTDMFEVSTYEDLALFPNLEKLWLGESKLDTVDLSKNWNLKYVHIESDNVKVIILAVGCTPKLAYPMHSGEIIVRRIKNPDAPGAMFFQY